jgi:UTP-glucose-1-phosphate uridylyltransferase
MIDAEDSGLDAAIEMLKEQVKDNGQAHKKAVRAALADFLQTDEVKQAKRIIAAVEAFTLEINPMIDFDQTDAFKYLVNNSRDDGVVALAELVEMPEEKNDPPELEILVDAQRAIRDTYTLATAGSQTTGGQRINFQPTDEARQKVKDEIEAKRQERLQRL